MARATSQFVTKTMQIIAILNPIEVRHRTLKVGLRYAYPPARGLDVFQVTPEQLLSLRNEAAKARRAALDRQGHIDAEKVCRRGCQEVRASMRQSRPAQLSDEEVGRYTLPSKILLKT